MALTLSTLIDLHSTQSRLCVGPRLLAWEYIASLCHISLTNNGPHRSMRSLALSKSPNFCCWHCVNNKIRAFPPSPNLFCLSDLHWREGSRSSYFQRDYYPRFFVPQFSFDKRLKLLFFGEQSVELPVFPFETWWWHSSRYFGSFLTTYVEQLLRERRPIYH